MNYETPGNICILNLNYLHILFFVVAFSSEKSGHPSLYNLKTI